MSIDSEALRLFFGWAFWSGVFLLLASPGMMHPFQGRRRE